MTLNDLKTGMIVTLRNNKELVVMRNVNVTDRDEHDFIVDPYNDDFDPFKYYNQNLTNAKGFKHLDIVKVEEASVHGCLCPRRDVKERKILWKEEPTKKLTVAEIEKLLGYKVEIVSEEE